MIDSTNCNIGTSVDRHLEIKFEIRAITKNPTKTWSNDSTNSKQDGHIVDSNTIPLVESINLIGIGIIQIPHTRIFNLIGRKLVHLHGVQSLNNVLASGKHLNFYKKIRLVTKYFQKIISGQMCTSSSIAF